VQLSHVSNSKQPTLSHQTHSDRANQKTLSLSEMCISGLARRARIYGSNTSASSNILRTVVACSRKWSNIWYYHTQTCIRVHASTLHQVRTDRKQPPAIILQRCLRCPNRSLWAYKQIFIQLTRRLQWLKWGAWSKWMGFAPQFLFKHTSSAGSIWFCSL